MLFSAEANQMNLPPFPPVVSETFKLFYFPSFFFFLNFFFNSQHSRWYFSLPAIKKKIGFRKCPTQTRQRKKKSRMSMKKKKKIKTKNKTKRATREDSVVFQFFIIGKNWWLHVGHFGEAMVGRKKKCPNLTTSSHLCELRHVLALWLKSRKDRFGDGGEEKKKKFWMFFFFFWCKRGKTWRNSSLHTKSHARYPKKN